MIRLCPQYCVRRKPHLSKRHRCSVNVPRTRNCHSGLVKIQQRLHKVIRCFIIVKKNAVVFYYEVKIIIEMWEKILTCSGVSVCATFKMVINRRKTDPPTIFFLGFIQHCTSFYHFRKTKYQFFLYCAGECMGKDVQIIINPQFYFTDTRKQLWICCNIYESVLSITSPLKTITVPLKEIKMVKTDQKRFQAKFYFCSFL